MSHVVYPILSSIVYPICVGKNKMPNIVCVTLVKSLDDVYGCLWYTSDYSI